MSDADEGITLRVVGLSADQGALVLADEDDERFVVAVDDATGAIATRSPALTASRYAAATDARPRSTEDSVPDTLRPRDIQARIRAGATVEDVVAESGMAADRIERFAGPMLAERFHVASLARDTEIRRDMASDTTLVRAVGERLRSVDLEESSAEWDAWRRDDGRWVVRIAYGAGRLDRRAHWVFDPRARSLVADDAEARWLVDPDAPEPKDSDRATSPRLAAVVALAQHEVEAEAALDDQAELMADEAEAALEVLNDLDADDGAGEDDPEGALLVLTEQVQTTLDDLDPTPQAAEPAAAAKPAKRKGRAAVPSWDDIVFGSRKPQD